MLFLTLYPRAFPRIVSASTLRRSEPAMSHSFLRPLAQLRIQAALAALEMDQVGDDAVAKQTDLFAPLGIGSGPLLLVLVGVPAAYLRAAWGAYRDRRRRGDPQQHAALYAGFCMLGKLPETVGILTYWSNRLRGRYSGLMEYKAAQAEGPSASQPVPVPAAPAVSASNGSPRPA